MSAAADASLFLLFSPTHVSPGNVVYVRSGGQGALADVPPGTLFPVYLAPFKESGVITSSNDKRLIRVGNLRVDAGGDGRFRFVVPRLPSGRYAGFIQCGRWCAPYSEGRVFLPVADGPVLDISGDGPAESPQSGGSSWLHALVAGAVGVGVAVVLVTLWWRTRYHRARVTR